MLMIRFLQNITLLILDTILLLEAARCQDLWINLSDNMVIKYKQIKVILGPQKHTMGYVAYTKGSFGENKVSSIGKKFKGISKLIKAAHKHNED